MSNPIGSNPGSTLSGLVSGLDWQTIVDRVMQVEGRPVSQLRQRVTAANDRSSAWGTLRKLTDAIRTSLKTVSDGTALDAVAATVTTTSSGGTQPLAAAATLGAGPGRYQVEILNLAQAEKLGGAQFASSSTPLGVSGEFWVNGVQVTVTAADSLANVRDKVNAANTGTSATKVTATLLQTGSASTRLVLTSDVSGIEGVSLSDGPDGVLGSLGFNDGTTTIKNPNSAGANGARFTSATTDVKTLLGLTGPSGPTDVTIGGQVVSIDLATEGLTTIAANIDALAGVSATVQSETTDGVTHYWLDIRGTTSFGDSGRLLEMLGVVEGGRAPVAQTVRGAVLTAGDASTPASAATAMTDLWSGGTAAAVQAGDTLTVTGKRGDGSAVSLTYTVVGGDTAQALLDRLNNAVDGFGAGVRPATASLDAQGRLVVTDNTTGDSQLAVSIVTHNEGGGSLDVGDLTVADAGRLRTMQAGADALLKVDGVSLSRSTNTVTDAVSGLTLTLLVAEAGKFASVEVGRNSAEAVKALGDFVKAFNELAGFVAAQRKVDPNNPTQTPALYGDSTLTQVRGGLINSLLNAVGGAATDLATAATVGLSIAKDGTISLDKAKFEKAFAERYSDVKKLSSALGAVTDPEVVFGGYGPRTQVGTYGVDITTLAAQATVMGAGFSGTYADDGTADTIAVTDVDSTVAVEVSLSNGMTTAQIVQSLNDAFALKLAQMVRTGSQLFSDAGGTVPVTAATTLASVRGAGGTPAGIAAGDTISYTGTRGDGSSFDGTYTVSDPATETVGDLVVRLQKDFGSTVTVSVTDGRLVVEQRTSGPSRLDLTMTAQNQGGGALDFGGVSQIVVGRNALGVTASAVGNDVVLTHNTWGSASGFSVAFTAGGADGTAQLGLGAGPYAGTDVGGTIGGFLATGKGQQLTGGVGTPVEGLTVAYHGTTARAAGNVSLSLGIGALMTRSLDTWLDNTSGLLKVKEDAVAAETTSLGGRVAAGDARLALKRAQLIKQFTSMEQVIAKLQQQQASLASQLSALRAA